MAVMPLVRLPAPPRMIALKGIEGEKVNSRLNSKLRWQFGIAAVITGGSCVIAAFCWFWVGAPVLLRLAHGLTHIVASLFQH